MKELRSIWPALSYSKLERFHKKNNKTKQEYIDWTGEL